MLPQYPWPLQARWNIKLSGDKFGVGVIPIEKGRTLSANYPTKFRQACNILSESYAIRVKALFISLKAIQANPWFTAFGTIISWSNIYIYAYILHISLQGIC